MENAMMGGEPEPEGMIFPELGGFGGEERYRNYGYDHNGDEYGDEYDEDGNYRGDIQMMGGTREKHQLQIPEGQRNKNDYFENKG